ncbi:MAG: ATP-binding protein [Bacteroidales bacterium]|nr:ATP-binding protein [Bacteroidales bacterium]MCF8388584.1 ATP-binding protein [Bacteroidales bacterium]
MRDFIKRDGYIEKIKPFIGKDLIKVLTGQRRVGKSYLLFQIIDEIKSLDDEANIEFINMELHDFAMIRNSDDLISYINSKLITKGKNYVFIDEIQDIENFEKALRHFQASNTAEIYCTGSNASLLSGELATLLSGRYIEFHVSGLSYNEFLRFLKIEDSNKALNRYIRFGSLPYIKNLPNDEAVIYEYIKSVYNTILYKDIVSRFNIRNTTLLENLLRFLMDNIGNIFSAKKISDYLKSQRINLSPKVIIEYIKHFEDAFLLYKVKRYGIAGKKIFDVGDKYYFEDLGIRHAIGGYKMSDMGKIIENLVFKHLQCNNYQVFVGKLGEKEIDFVARKENDVLYIQVAYRIDDKKTHDREFGNLLMINDNFRKIVVSMDDYIEGSYEGIEHMHIREFLLSEF